MVKCAPVGGLNAKFYQFYGLFWSRFANKMKNLPLFGSIKTLAFSIAGDRRHIVTILGGAIVTTMLILSHFEGESKRKA